MVGVEQHRHPPDGDPQPQRPGSVAVAQLLQHAHGPVVEREAPGRRDDPSPAGDDALRDDRDQHPAQDTRGVTDRGTGDHAGYPGRGRIAGVGGSSVPFVVTQEAYPVVRSTSVTGLSGLRTDRRHQLDRICGETTLSWALAHRSWRSVWG